MRKNIYFIFVFLQFFYSLIYGWESQLFPFNSVTGKYQEAVVNFNGRNWKLLDYSYTGYNLGNTGLRKNIPCNIQTITGSGDITAELQTKIDAVGAAGGGIVRIPAGTFTITEHTLHGGLKPIGINYPNVSIEGAGSGRTIINVPPTHTYSSDANAFEGVFTFEKSRWAWNKGWVDRGTVLSGITQPIAEGATYLTGVTNLAGIAVNDWIII